jgi:hypothetical protein
VSGPPLRLGQRWPFRAWIVGGDGKAIEMTIVRGCDGLPGTPEGRRVFHLFGPPMQPLPDTFHPHVNNVPEDALLHFEIMRDDLGVLRFRPAYQLAHTLN